MQGAAVLRWLLAIAGPFKPCLRVVGLAYTGLGGMLAMVVVVSVALLPVAPVLHQVAEPAVQAMSNLVQPTSNAVAGILGASAFVFVDYLPPQHQVAFSDAIELDVTIEDMPLEVPVAAVAAAAPRAAVALVGRATPELVDEFLEVEPLEVSAPHGIGVVVAAPPAGLQIASQEAPKPLRAVPKPTETVLQVKVRKDAENQAAIDAAKAAQVRAKAEADAANNAAIAALKVTVAAATANATSVPRPTPTAVPTVPSNVTPNRAPIQTSTGGKTLAKATATPPARPTSPAAHPTAQPTPAVRMTTPTTARPPTQPPSTVAVIAIGSPTVSIDAVERHPDEASLEDVPIDQAVELLSDATDI